MGGIPLPELAPPPETPLPPPVLDGGRLADDPPALEDVGDFEPLDGAEPGGLGPDAGFDAPGGVPIGGLGTALATAEPLVGLGAGEVGTRDIAILDNEQSN